MDNGPLWSQDPQGNYWLLFPNRHALDKYQIKDIFSQYGKVKLITESGNEKGLRFVQYSCLDDVKNAVNNLKDHPQIKLVPYRPKSKNNQNGNVRKEENIDVNPSKRILYQRKSSSNYNHSSSDESKLSSDSSKIDLQNTEYDSNYDKASTCSSNTSNSQINLNGSSINSDCINKLQTVHIIDPIHVPKSVSNTNEKVKRLLQNRGIISNTFNASTVLNDSNCDDQDELPDLVSSNKVKLQAPSRKVIYNADEVIVANIPNDYGSAYILHLFEKFEPLAISCIKTEPINNIRYCHVYFKSVKDSMGAETMFDKCDLYGKQLVVLRTCNLEEEVITN